MPFLAKLYNQGFKRIYMYFIIFIWVINAFGVEHHLIENQNSAPLVHSKQNKNDSQLLLDQDKKIAGKIKTILNEYDFEKFQPDIIVKNGSVSLYGVVKSQQKKDSLVYMISDISGVKSVENNLKIQNKFKLQSDAVIEDDLEKRIEQNNLLGNKEITVIVQDGIVFIAGIVNHWYTKQEMIRIAYLSGALSVDEHIIIVN